MQVGADRADRVRSASKPDRIEIALAYLIDPVQQLVDVVARLRSHGAELVGEIAQYQDSYRLCFLRGPEGIIIGLAEQIG